MTVFIRFAPRALLLGDREPGDPMAQAGVGRAGQALGTTLTASACPGSLTR